MTDKEFIEALQIFNSGIIIVNDETGEEFEIDSIQTTMGGCYHNEIHLKTIKDDKNKWYKSRESWIMEKKQQLDLYKSPEWHQEWLSLPNPKNKKNREDSYQELIRKKELEIDSLISQYLPGEILD